MSNTSSLAAVIQINSGASLVSNLEQAKTLLKKAADQGAQLAVLPENFAFMGTHEHDKLAHAEADGAGVIQDFLAETAQQLNLWIIAGTLPIRADDQHVYAANCVYAANGERKARYDKIHLFDVNVSEQESYRESNSIAAGALTPTVVDTPIGKLGLSVCYDLRFPELYRQLVDLGAEVLCVPAAFTYKTGLAHWHTLLKARAIENQCFLLAAGQVGAHPGNRQTFGHSLIINYWGETLAECAQANADFAIAALDHAQRKTLLSTFPALKHRRF